MFKLFSSPVGLFIFSLMNLGFFSNTYALEKVQTADATRVFVKNVLKTVIEDMQVTDQTYETYFSKDYIQHVDGKTLNYTDFVNHMKAQKTILASASVSFKYIIVEGSTVATLHFVDALKRDGTSLRVQVNAVFQVKDHQFILCDELTRLIQGSKGDENVGSCHEPQADQSSQR